MGRNDLFSVRVNVANLVVENDMGKVSVCKRTYFLVFAWCQYIAFKVHQTVSGIIRDAVIGSVVFWCAALSGACLLYPLWYSNRIGRAESFVSAH